MDITEVKEMKGITDDSKDAQIATLIPKVEQSIRAYCNIPETEDLPPEYDMNIANIIYYEIYNKPGIQSESLSRHSVSYIPEYPKELTQGLRRRLRW